MQRVLITGGAGFIGSRVASELLAGGFAVRILDSLSAQIHGALPGGLSWLRESNIEFIRGSVVNPADVQHALSGVSHVLHLAAETGTGQSMYDIARYNEVNTQGTAVLLDVMVNRPDPLLRTVVLASSRSVYGEGAYVCSDCGGECRSFPIGRDAAHLQEGIWNPVCATCGAEMVAVPTREDDPVRPASIYAATKLAQEDLVRIACESIGVGYAILRFQNVYGEGQSLNNPYTGILSIFSTRFRKGLEVPIFEDGNESRDFVHVDDVARALVAAITRDQAPRTTINVGSGLATSVLEIAEGLARALGVEPKLRVTGEYRLGDIRHNVADIDRLATLLDCAPRVSIQDGLNRFARWVIEQELPEDRLVAANNELRSRGMMGSARAQH
jgi:dTDP-L-rhamnose 4-epimerase